MAYNDKLAAQVKRHLGAVSGLQVKEQKMFGGLTFMVNLKMCISVSGENLMCRFDPAMHDVVAEKKGFEPMLMKGKLYRGFGYVTPDGFRLKKDFGYWINLCLTYNAQVQTLKRKQ